MKSIWVLTLVLAFVAGSVLTGTMAYAASNAQGEPFKEIKAMIKAIETEIIALTLVSHAPITVTDIEDFGFELGPHTDVGIIETEIVELKLVSHDPITVSDVEDFGFELGPHTDVSDIETRLAELESRTPTLCDPNGDGMITAKELAGYITLGGFPATEAQAASIISSIESGVGSTPNGKIDTADEFTALNAALGALPPCP